MISLPGLQYLLLCWALGRISFLVQILKFIRGFHHLQSILSPKLQQRSLPAPQLPKERGHRLCFLVIKSFLITLIPPKMILNGKGALIPLIAYISHALYIIILCFLIFPCNLQRNAGQGKAISSFQS